MEKIWEKGVQIGRVRFTPEHIIRKLREAKVLLG